MQTTHLNSSRTGRVLLLLSLAAFTTVPATALAQDRERSTQAIMDRLIDVLADKAKRENAIAAGEERTMLCTRCHGEDGNSVNTDVPNLAGQNPSYLVEQMRKYADGRRSNFVMQALARGFTGDDTINISLFYSSMPVKPIESDPQQAAKGRGIYEGQCQACHGHDGRGESGYARLSGQQMGYVRNILKHFRDGEAGDSPMTKVARNLADDDIQALAAYIAQLR